MTKMRLLCIFGVAQVAEGEAGLGIGHRAGFVVVGDGDQVAHRHGHAARVRREADELLAVVRQNHRLVQVEPGQPPNLRLHHARLRDGGMKLFATMSSPSRLVK